MLQSQKIAKRWLQGVTFSFIFNRVWKIHKLELVNMSSVKKLPLLLHKNKPIIYFRGKNIKILFKYD